MFAPRRAKRADRPDRAAIGPSSHPDQVFLIQINLLQSNLPGYCLLRESLCGSFTGFFSGPAVARIIVAKQLSQLVKPLSEYGRCLPPQLSRNPRPCNCLGSYYHCLSTAVFESLRSTQSRHCKSHPRMRNPMW